MEILEQIEAWSKKGIFIEYIIMDQYENGYGEAVERGEMQPYTYTVSVLQNGDPIFEQSFDHLAEALEAGLAFAKERFGTEQA